MKIDEEKNVKLHHDIDLFNLNRSLNITTSAPVQKKMYSKANKLSLKNMIKYLSDLKSENKINDTTFIELVHHACSIFIENEIEKKMSDVLENKISIYLTKHHVAFK